MENLLNSNNLNLRTQRYPRRPFVDLFIQLNSDRIARRLANIYYWKKKRTKLVKEPQTFSLPFPLSVTDQINCQQKNFSHCFLYLIQKLGTNISTLCFSSSYYSSSFLMVLFRTGIRTRAPRWNPEEETSPSSSALLTSMPPGGRNFH